MLSAEPMSRVRPAAAWAARRLRELADDAGWGRGRSDAVVPPRRLRARTGAPGIEEFAEGGRRAAEELDAALAAGGLPGLEHHSSVLDFGCGSCRVLPHVAARAGGAGRAGEAGRAGGTRCAGADVDAEAVAWAASRHPSLELAACGPEPPLPFAAGRFDLVYSISVFSHLDEPLQDAWLSELRRMLRPGGIALLSVHGASALEAFRAGRVSSGWCDPAAFTRGALGADELAFVPYRRSRWNREQLPGVSEAYGLTFHGEGYVRRRWSAWFEVLDVLPRTIAGWQDLVVCRRA